jgi:hypothetical protein
MITESFHIAFAFMVDPQFPEVQLTAEVEVHHSTLFYVVRNFRVPRHGDRIVLPEISIKKVNDQWVHLDSGHPTSLSMAAGRAIDTVATSP